MVRGKKENLTGRRYGRLVVLGKTDKVEWGRPVWECRCDCGAIIPVNACNLGRSTKSCGCFRREQCGKVGRRGWKHGLSGTPRHNMWGRAKKRAAAKGLPFTIELMDIPEIPECCPILGFALKSHAGKMQFNSPTLDRIRPELGYVPGNLQIISQRANVVKNDASAEELVKVANYMLNLEKGST